MPLFIACCWWRLGPLSKMKRGFPKTRVTFWGVPIIRIIICWGLYWGPLISGNYKTKQIAARKTMRALDFLFTASSCQLVTFTWDDPHRKVDGVLVKMFVSGSLPFRST